MLRGYSVAMGLSEAFYVPTNEEADAPKIKSH